MGVPYVKNKLGDIYDGLTGGDAARLLGDDIFDEEEEEEEEDPSPEEDPTWSIRLKRVRELRNS